MNKLEENWELYKLGIPWKETEGLEGDERDFLLKQAGEIRTKMEEQQKQQEEMMKQQEAMRQAAMQQQQGGSMQGQFPPQNQPPQPQPPQLQQSGVEHSPFPQEVFEEKDKRIAELEKEVAGLGAAVSPAKAK